MNPVAGDYGFVEGKPRFDTSKRNRQWNADNGVAIPVTGDLPALPT